MTTHLPAVKFIACIIFLFSIYYVFFAGRLPASTERNYYILRLLGKYLDNEFKKSGKFPNDLSMWDSGFAKTQKDLLYFSSGFKLDIIHRIDSHNDERLIVFKENPGYEGFLGIVFIIKNQQMIVRYWDTQQGKDILSIIRDKPDKTGQSPLNLLKN